MHPIISLFHPNPEQAILIDLQVQTRLLRQFQPNHSSVFVEDKDDDDDDDDSVRNGNVGSAVGTESRSRLRSESVTIVLLRGLGLLDPAVPTASIDFVFPWQQQPQRPQEQQQQQQQQQRGCEEDKGYELDTNGGASAGSSTSGGGGDVGTGGGGLMPLCVALHVMVAAELFSEDVRHELGDHRTIDKTIVQNNPPY